MGNITDLTTSWEDYTKGDVEDLIKNEFTKLKTESNDAFRDAVFDPIAMAHYFFSSEEDKVNWMATKDASLIKKTVPFEFSGDVWQMTVINLLDSKNLYFAQNAETAFIRLTYKSEKKKFNDTVWVEEDEPAYVTVSIDRGATGNYTPMLGYDGKLINHGEVVEVDIRKFLAVGDNRVKVRVEGADSGTSSFLTYSVMLTAMYIAPANFQWNEPFIEGNTYKLGGLYIGGSIDKKLHIKVSNKNGYEQPYEYPIGQDTYTDIAFNYEGLAFPDQGTGVYSVEIWLDANGLQSEHLHYNIMCVSAADITTARLVAISEVPEVVKNYDTNKLFSYAMYYEGKSIASPIVNVSASINNTPTPVITNEVLSDVATKVINDYVIDLAVETQETNISLYASIELEGGEKQDAMYGIDNSASFPAVQGATFHLNPANRNNAQANKTTIINESNLANATNEYTATWTNVAFTDGMDGWTIDNFNRKCLRLPATSSVVIDYAPLANAVTRTIELSYRVENASNYEEDIISIASNLTSNFVGARVKPTNVLVHSNLLRTEDLKQGYNTKDEELVHLVITIIQKYKGIGNLAQIYVNGIKKCSFTWSNEDTFAHNEVLRLGSQTADLYIYKMRVYDRGFDWLNVVQNYLNCLPDTASKKAAHKRIREVLNDGNKIDFDAVKKAGLNYFVVRLPQGKELPSYSSKSSVSGTRLEINIQQNPQFVINGIYEDETIEGQGTTAMDYFRWNLRWKTDKVRITAKKNFASSMHDHKMGATALFNDLNIMIVGANEADARVAVEQYGAYGFQEVLIEGSKDAYTYVPIGLYTIGQDKGDKATFGYNNPAYKDTLIHLEGTDHFPKAVGMDYPWDKLGVATNNDGDANLGVRKADGSVKAAWEIGACGRAKTDAEMYDYLTYEFKPAYDVDYRNTSLIIGFPSEVTIDMINQSIAEVQALEVGNGFTVKDCLLWIDGEYKTYYYDEEVGKYMADGINILDDLGITEDAFTSTDVMERNAQIIALRKERYRAEMQNYWHLDDSLFHYCFIVLFAATDNFKKNTYPYKFGTLESGSRWRWRQDDLDTLFDINNQGLANKMYSILNGDKADTSHLFNGNNSYHWTNIHNYYENEIKAMMIKIMTTMASLSPTDGSLIERAVGCIRHYFWDKAQNYFSESAYNLDAEWTYEAAWYAKNEGKYQDPSIHPLSQSLGSHYEAEVAWVEKRFIFMASMFGFGTFATANYEDDSLGRIAFRQGAGTNTFTLTPAIDMNPTILVGTSDRESADERILAGTPTTLSVHTDGDTSIYIQGVDYLSDIGDLSKIALYAPEPKLSVKSKRLQRLKVGDATPSNVTTLLKDLEIKSCPSLSEVDARNVTTLVGAVDLSQCPRLTKALFGGSSVGNITLPNGSKITEFELPDTLSTLSLINLPNLTESGLQYGDISALAYLRVENNANIEGYALLKATYNAGSPLTNIRVIGFDYDGTADDAQLLANLASGGHFGINSDGSRNPNILPVIEGTIHITDPVNEEEYNAVVGAFPALTLDATNIVRYIKFDDPVVAQICADNWGDKTGITPEQAAAVTSIGTVFKGNTEITSFDELAKFTSVKSLANGAFQGCSSLTSIGLGNIETFGINSVASTALAYDELVLPNAKIVDQYAFDGAKIKSLQLPNIESYTSGNVYISTWGDKDFIEEIILSDKITKLNDYIFYKHTKLSRIGVRWEGVTVVGKSAFSDCAAFSASIVIPNVISLGDSCFESSSIISIVATSVTTIGAYSFRYCDKLRYAVLSDVITSIGNYAFRGCEVMQALVIPATTPPTLGTNVFMSPNNCLIYVPDPDGTGAIVQKYKTATNWSAYASRIFPISQLEIDNPELYAEVEGYL